MRPTAGGSWIIRSKTSFFGPTGPASLPETGATLSVKLEPLWRRAWPIFITTALPFP